MEQGRRQFAKHGVVADVSDSPGKAPAKSGEVVVVAAHFGGQEVTALAKLLFSQDAIFVIDTKGHPPFRDPWKGVTKSISVIYRSNNDALGMWRVFARNADAESVWTPTAVDISMEPAGVFLIDPYGHPSPSSLITVHTAIYGLEQFSDESVYTKLYTCASKNEVVEVSNAFFEKDTWPEVQKSAEVVYSVGDTLKTIFGRERAGGIT
ncbi:unnamed protein product [Colletotrichum tofieldiae]|nr:unnamed protein product [Colletotrichum tofieldiae]GKT88193.1 unnamed protein product [Colletotrichum tofieldiae]